MNIGFHQLARSDFDELASGRARSELIDRLRMTQLSRRMLALRAVMDDAARLAPEAAARSELSRSYGALAEAQRASGHAVAELLLSPGFGLWSMHCLRRMRGTVQSHGTVAADLAGLGALAVVAALRAGVDVEVTVFVPGGELMLPTLGRRRCKMSGWAWARVTGGEVAVCPQPGGTEGPAETEGTAGDSAVAWSEKVAVPGGTACPEEAWLAVPTVSGEVAGERIELRLDFLDPGRHHLGLPVSGDLDPVTIEVWQLRLGEGWRLLHQRDPTEARALAAGITTIVPLRAADGATELSASAGEAVGAVAMTLPSDGLSFAAALLHEFQHNKLSALLDLVTLYEPAEGRLFYAPWRADPRPLGGLLQGAYAYLGLTRFWDDERRANPGHRYAHFEFARWREEVWRVLTTMRLSGAMTPLGLRFLDGMQAAAWPHRLAQVPDEPLWLAARMSAESRLTWRLRNLEPRWDQIAALARAWLAGGPFPNELRVTTRVMPGPRAQPHSVQLKLTHFRLREPRAFAAARDGVPRVFGDDVTETDQAHAFGDLPAAEKGYRERIALDPDRLEAWAGLALCAWESAATDAHVLATCPELVRAVHRVVEELGGGRPDPAAVASWLSTSPLPPGLGQPR